MAEEPHNRRESDRNAAQQAVRADVFEKVEQVTGVLLTPGMVQNEHARVALSSLLDRLEEAEKARDTDALTGVFNRGSFDREMNRQIELKNRHKENHPPITVVMFDINDFKAVNTEHTHAGGDHAIKHVGRVLAQSVEETAAERMADILKHSLRTTDFVARLGGDEFAVIMYDTKDSQPLKARLEAIRQKIIETPCEFQGKTIKLGVAYGVHELAVGDSIPSIIANFSAKMFAHKKVVKAPKGAGQDGQGGGITAA